MTRLRITPLRDWLLVVLEDAPPQQSAIEVVRLQQQPSVYATVRAIGPEVREVRVGERVVVSRLQGIEVPGGVLLPESAVLARASDAQANGDDA